MNLPRDYPDIVDVVTAAGIVLRPQGEHRYAALCPFHDDHNPSFMITPSKGLWRCFGCGVGGGAAEFVRRHTLLTGGDGKTNSVGHETLQEDVTLA